MTAPTGAANRRRGKDTERKVRDHLRANGFPFCDYTRAGAAADRGDLSGVIDRDGDWWVVEVKGWRQTQPEGEIQRAAEEAESEAIHAGARQWCVIVRKPGCSDIGQWFVYLPLDLWPRALPWVGPAEHMQDLTRLSVRAWLALVAPQTERVGS